MTVKVHVTVNSVEQRGPEVSDQEETCCHLCLESRLSAVGVIQLVSGLAGVSLDCGDCRNLPVCTNEGMQFVSK